MMTRASRKSQAGFSLLEMLIAVGILSAAAYVALDTVENDSGQIRYDLTENKLAKVRRAIVGDPDLSVNGSPAISGFVADTGRLPRCLDALLVRDPDCNGNGTVDSDPGEIIQVDAPQEFAEVVSEDEDDPIRPGLSFGWRGPYVSGGTRSISDGWGNGQSWARQSRPFVGGNHGWKMGLQDDDGIDYASVVDDTTGISSTRDGSSTPVLLPANAILTQLGLKSFGRDRIDDTDTGASTDGFDEDQYMGGSQFDDGSPIEYSIVQDDYSVDMTTTAISFDVLYPVNSSDPNPLNLCVAMIAPHPNDPDDWIVIPNGLVDYTASATSSAPQKVFQDDAARTTVTFSAPLHVTQGTRPLILYDANNTVVPTTNCLIADAEDQAKLLDNLVADPVRLVVVPRVLPTKSANLTLNVTP